MSSAAEPFSSEDYLNLGTGYFHVLLESLPGSPRKCEEQDSPRIPPLAAPHRIPQSNAVLCTPALYSKDCEACREGGVGNWSSARLHNFSRREVVTASPCPCFVPSAGNRTGWSCELVQLSNGYGKPAYGHGFEEESSCGECQKENHAPGGSVRSHPTSGSPTTERVHGGVLGSHGRKSKITQRNQTFVKESTLNGHRMAETQRIIPVPGEAPPKAGDPRLRFPQDEFSLPKSSKQDLPPRRSSFGSRSPSHVPLTTNSDRGTVLSQSVPGIVSSQPSDVRADSPKALESLPRGPAADCVCLVCTDERRDDLASVDEEPSCELCMREDFAAPGTNGDQTQDGLSRAPLRSAQPRFLSKSEPVSHQALQPLRRTTDTREQYWTDFGDSRKYENNLARPKATEGDSYQIGRTEYHHPVYKTELSPFDHPYLIAKPVALPQPARTLQSTGTHQDQPTPSRDKKCQVYEYNAQDAAGHDGPEILRRARSKASRRFLKPQHGLALLVKRKPAYLTKSMRGHRTTEMAEKANKIRLKRDSLSDMTTMPITHNKILRKTLAEKPSKSASSQTQTLHTGPLTARAPKVKRGTLRFKTEDEPHAETRGITHAAEDQCVLSGGYENQAPEKVSEAPTRGPSKQLSTEEGETTADDFRREEKNVKESPKDVRTQASLAPKRQKAILAAPKQKSRSVATKPPVEPAKRNKGTTASAGHKSSRKAQTSSTVVKPERLPTFVPYAPVKRPTKKTERRSLSATRPKVRKPVKSEPHSTASAGRYIKGGKVRPPRGAANRASTSKSRKRQPSHEIKPEPVGRCSKPSSAQWRLPGTAGKRFGTAGPVGTMQAARDFPADPFDDRVDARTFVTKPYRPEDNNKCLRTFLKLARKLLSALITRGPDRTSRKRSRKDSSRGDWMHTWTARLEKTLTRMDKILKRLSKQRRHKPPKLPLTNAPAKVVPVHRIRRTPLTAETPDPASKPKKLRQKTPKRELDRNKKRDTSTAPRRTGSSPATLQWVGTTGDDPPREAATVDNEQSKLPTRNASKETSEYRPHLDEREEAPRVSKQPQPLALFLPKKVTLRKPARKLTSTKPKLDRRRRSTTATKPPKTRTVSLRKAMVDSERPPKRYSAFRSVERAGLSHQNRSAAEPVRHRVAVKPSSKRLVALSKRLDDIYDLLRKRLRISSREESHRDGKTGLGKPVMDKIARAVDRAMTAYKMLSVSKKRRLEYKPLGKKRRRTRSSDKLRRSRTRIEKLIVQPEPQFPKEIPVNINISCNYGCARAGVSSDPSEKVGTAREAALNAKHDSLPPASYAKKALRDLLGNPPHAPVVQNRAAVKRSPKRTVDAEGIRQTRRKPRHAGTTGSFSSRTEPAAGRRRKHSTLNQKPKKRLGTSLSLERRRGTQQFGKPKGRRGGGNERKEKACSTSPETSQSSINRKSSKRLQNGRDVSQSRRRRSRSSHSPTSRRRVRNQAISAQTPRRYRSLSHTARKRHKRRTQSATDKDDGPQGGRLQECLREFALSKFENDRLGKENRRLARMTEKLVDRLVDSAAALGSGTAKTQQVVGTTDAKETIQKAVTREPGTAAPNRPPPNKEKVRQRYPQNQARVDTPHHTTSRIKETGNRNHFQEDPDIAKSDPQNYQRPRHGNSELPTGQINLDRDLEYDYSRNPMTAEKKPKGEKKCSGLLIVPQRKPRQPVPHPVGPDRVLPEKPLVAGALGNHARPKETDQKDNEFNFHLADVKGAEDLNSADFPPPRRTGRKLMYADRPVRQNFRAHQTDRQDPEWKPCDLLDVPVKNCGSYDKGIDSLVNAALVLGDCVRNANAKDLKTYGDDVNFCSMYGHYRLLG